MYTYFPDEIESTIYNFIFSHINFSVWNILHELKSKGKFVSLAVAFSVVTQQERCVTTLKRAARETSNGKSDLLL